MIKGPFCKIGTHFTKEGGCFDRNLQSSLGLLKKNKTSRALRKIYTEVNHRELLRGIGPFHGFSVFLAVTAGMQAGAKSPWGSHIFHMDNLTLQKHYGYLPKKGFPRFPIFEYWWCRFTAKRKMTQRNYCIVFLFKTQHGLVLLWCPISETVFSP